ncbi:hypothetical protein PG991_003528 [Apiospora marii]|uniref:NADH dehydrogenase [ubiquinone] 1 alpha subcomplex subunit n=1 Tax=Apiospora marii TaxID=335849 RepID=A0ABR1S5X3_9PEZI
MSSSNVGLVMRAWFRWKALRLPWRKRFLVGSDLQGNTYWIFRLTGNTPPPNFDASPDSPAYQSSADDTRWRRIVKYPRSTHYSDVQVPPQWHQWLRYRRPDPPSLREQQADVARRARMQVLAAEADARWAAKPSFLDPPPQEEQPQPKGKSAAADQDTLSQPVAKAQGRGAEEAVTGEVKKEAEKDDPWKKAATGPSETWQPTSWYPSTSRKR